jgi:hypothetical protein
MALPVFHQKKGAFLFPPASFLLLSFLPDLERSGHIFKGILSSFKP